MNIKEIIEITVNETVKKLQSERLIKKKSLVHTRKRKNFYTIIRCGKKTPKRCRFARE